MGNRSHEPSLIATIIDTNMDDLRDSSSRFEKDVEDPLGRSKPEADKPGPAGREENVGSSSSLPQPEPRVSTGGGREQGGGPNTENENVTMDDLLDSLSRRSKDVNDRLGRSKPEADKPGPGGREEGVSSSSSFPQPEPHVSTGGGREQAGGGLKTENENVGVSSAADENRPGWKSTASSSAKLVLRAVRDSSDAFGPLKSVAGGLCFMLENCEVRYLPSWPVSDAYVSAANESEQTGD